MVEVFKTNVRYPEEADLLIALIHQAFSDYTANFDLDDCDNILRVVSKTGSIQSTALITLLKDFGFEAEVLPDDIPIWRATFVNHHDAIVLNHKHILLADSPGSDRLDPLS